MKQTEFEFMGETYYLSLSADALFKIYDKFGMTDDIIKTTQCMEPTGDGWVNCCWLVALLSAQGELQRRRLGYTPGEMLTLEKLRVCTMPSEVFKVREALQMALAQGFQRSIAQDEDQEVDLVLAERDAEVKKAKALGDSVLSILRRLRDGCTSHQGTPSC